MLARVLTEWAWSRGHYQYWDGAKFSRHIGQARPVLTDIQHGQIFPSTLFAPMTGRDHIFVGCNSFGDSKVLLGTSRNPEGPFTVAAIADALPLKPMPIGSYSYCVYPHPWAFDESKGDLMVTWSEGGMDGNVVAVVIRLKLTHYE
jgi:hypothetical protein